MSVAIAVLKQTFAGVLVVAGLWHLYQAAAWLATRRFGRPAHRVRRKPRKGAFPNGPIRER